MNNQGKIISIIGVFLILSAYVLLYTPVAEMLFMPKKTTYQKQIIQIIPAAQPTAKTEIKTIEAAAANYNEEIPKFVVLRDPFEVNFSYAKPDAPPDGQSKPADPVPPKKYLVLQGILISDDVKTAIIDDKVVSENAELYDGWRLAEIRTDSVLLRKGGKVKILRIK
ncbi:MAG: hypothetical protein FD145_896 [Candidatus Saganbacteria bacterium]|uniref:Uncharacterized protein n=1 Tax=Candidatus Saganbacteria bacterium TaxID=2575572 RepID=A0A833L0Z7_UNCSA|nr:MAG: hypothetical protein FD145_896 [Candidatus Saganbacteria bacterium]